MKGNSMSFNLKVIVICLQSNSAQGRLNTMRGKRIRFDALTRMQEVSTFAYSF